jgi:fructokinase
MFTVVGEALVDLVQSRENAAEFSAHAGGSPYNVAITLARLDQSVSLVARSGQDAFGRMLEDKARASGVGFDRWQIVAEPTSLAVASLDPDGGATYDFYLDSTAGLAWDDSLVDLVPTGGVLHLGSLASWRAPSGPVLQAMQRRAFESGTTLVSYDPNVRPALIAHRDAARASIERCVAAAHVVKASDEDLAYLYPDVAPGEVAARWGVPLAVVTLGRDGAVAIGPDGELARCAGRDIVVADTVGAGDSFAGGLLAALADADVTSPHALERAGRDVIGAALERAVAVSALTCERRGAEPPTTAELAARWR